MKPTDVFASVVDRTEVVIHFELPPSLDIEQTDAFFDAATDALKDQLKAAKAQYVEVDLFIGNAACNPYFTITYLSDPALMTLPNRLKEIVMNTEIPSNTESEGGDHD